MGNIPSEILKRGLDKPEKDIADGRMNVFHTRSEHINVTQIHKKMKNSKKNSRTCDIL